MACGQYHQIGDEELSTPTRVVETGCDSGSCTLWESGISVFQANQSTSWEWVWPKGYDSNRNPQPWYPDGGEGPNQSNMIATCNSIFGVGDNGDFLVTVPKNGNLASYHYNVGTKKWTLWVDKFNFARTGEYWQVFDQTVYGYTTNIPDGTSSRSFVRK